MSFDLFGFDCLKRHGIYGFWIGCVTNNDDEKRSLLCIHHQEGGWLVQVFWLTLVNHY